MSCQVVNIPSCSVCRLTMSLKFLLVSVSLLSPALGLVPRQSTSCRAIPGDPGWPSTSAWDSLNDTVHGRLSATVPLPSVCHDQPFGGYNEDACTAIKAAWLDDTTLYVRPLSCCSYLTVWQSEQCSRNHEPRHPELLLYPVFLSLAALCNGQLCQLLDQSHRRRRCYCGN